MGAGALALLALVALGPWAWVSAASRGHVHHLDDAPSAPVALVLGAGLNPDGSPSAFLAGRLEVARALYASGRARVILVSGDNRVANYDEPTAMREWLAAHGVPEDAVVRDFAGRDTYDSCVRAKRIFGVNRALIVSQGYHLPRAVYTCRRLGIDAVGLGGSELSSHTSDTLQYTARELLSSLKASWQLITKPKPHFLGPHETGLDKAVAAGRP